MSLCDKVNVPDNYRGLYRNDTHTEEELTHLYSDEVKNVVDQLRHGGKGVCAYIAESMQSCGGQVIFPQQYLSQVYK